MESRLAIGDDLISFSFQETPHYVRRKARQNAYFSVPQTDTGGLVEKTKVTGRWMIKELGKKTRRNLWEMPFPTKSGCNKSLLSDCLSKTQVPAKPKGNV